MNSLRFLKLKFHVIAKKDYSVRNFIGNKLRGALGRSMVSLYCVYNELRCEDCEMLNSCIYKEVFKPILSSDEFTTQPAPFVLDVSQMDCGFIKEGKKLSFSISIFGERIKYWEEMILSVIDIFKRNTSDFNQSFSVLEVVSELEQKRLWINGDFLFEPQAVIWSDRRLEQNSACKKELGLFIEFKSALLTKEDKTCLTFSEFIDMVFYRIASMVDLYEEKELILPYRLLNRKPYVMMECMEKGTKGRIVYRGDIMRYLPYIELGRHLHIGKKTTYGFGEYCYKLLNDVGVKR